MEEASAPSAYERYRNITARIYRLLDERLADWPYLAGEDYSIADIATYRWAGYVDVHEMNWADFPNLARWRTAISERPAAGREAEVRAQLAYEAPESLESASEDNLNRFWWRAD